MGLLEHLFISAVNLVIVGVDMIGLFMIVRALVIHWPKRPLVLLDRVGAPVVNPLLSAVSRAVPFDWNLGVRRQRTFGIALTLVVISICRMALSALAT